MLALVASIHAFTRPDAAKTWMVGTSPTMTGDVAFMSSGFFADAKPRNSAVASSKPGKR